MGAPAPRRLQRRLRQRRAEAEPQSPLRPPAKEEEGEEEPARLDYRDDAFGDVAPREALPISPAERPWSRAQAMSCEQGSRGVRKLSLIPTDADITLSTSGSSLSHDVVKGSRFTWTRGDTIGRGALGRVFKALDQATGQMLAVKEVLVSKSLESDKIFVEALENEISILKELSHPHIVSYLGHDYIDDCLYMYLEHMPGGSMTQALQQFGAFEECLMASYSRQLLDGLEYLHTRPTPVVHRDIKGSNVLVGMSGGVKLADFGCSKRTQETMTHTMRGSIPWMAPEVIAHTRYGRAADMWSFGCVVIEMGTATVPWGRFDNQMAALVKIGLSQETPPLPEGISTVCQDFIQQCVRREPAQRPSTTDMLNHELVRDLLPFTGS